MVSFVHWRYSIIIFYHQYITVAFLGNLKVTYIQFKSNFRKIIFHLNLYSLMYPAIKFQQQQGSPLLAIEVVHSGWRVRASLCNAVVRWYLTASRLTKGCTRSVASIVIVVRFATHKVSSQVTSLLEVGVLPIAILRIAATSTDCISDIKLKDKRNYHVWVKIGCSVVTCSGI